MPSRLLISLIAAASLAVPATAGAIIAPTSTITYNSFVDDTFLILPGDSFPSNGALRLTENVSDQQGAMWSTGLYRPEQTWSTHFRFMIGGNKSGDGLAFVIQNDPEKAGAVGLGGSDLGYAGISPSYAVEFDQFVFGDNTGADNTDPNYPHVATVANGDPSNGHRQIWDPPFDLTGQEIDAWVEYNAGAQQVKVFVSDDGVKPATPQITDNVDLHSIGTTALVGFTAGTGAATATHDILFWSFTGIDGEGQACDVMGGPDADVIPANEASQVICGRGGDDVIDGGGGNDTIVGGGGNDRLRGQDGDDHLEGGTETDALIGGLGSDDMGGGKGIDIVRYPGRVADLFINLTGANFFFEGDPGGADGALGDNVRGDVENAEGGAGNDTIGGNDRNNLVYGRAGDDRITGLGGNDALYGEAGFDNLNGNTDDSDRKDRLDCGADRGYANYSPKDVIIGCDFD